MIDLSTRHSDLVRSILAMALVLTFASCQSEGPNLGVTVDDVVDDPEQYEGQTVTVSGEIDEAYGGTAFTIGGGAFGEDLLVIAPPGVDIRHGRTGDV